jgi:ubiquinone/menaquinone biosynthesis C-methylase UbiE
MAELPKRLAELSANRRQLLDRLLAGTAVAKAPVAASPGTPGSTSLALETLSPQKAECRRFYDEISRGLDSSAFGQVSLFLNLGYSDAGDPAGRASDIDLPEQYLNKNSVRLVLEVIGRCDVTRRRILDVGCGRGGTASVLRQFFKAGEIFGVDLAPAAIAFCRAKHHDLNLQFEIGDAERLMFPDGSFHIVTNIESSSTYPDICAFYHEVFRVLTPAGSFLYTDALPAGRFAECAAYLQRIGFHLVLDRDITVNVLASCDQISSHRMRAYEGGETMADFLAAPGSNIYEQMRRGEWTYRIQRWNKPTVFG